MDNRTPTKHLYRSRQQRMIAGVCGGLAEYFNMDPTWVRLLFVLFFFLGLGTLLLVYILFWIIVPEAPINKPNNDIING